MTAFAAAVDVLFDDPDIAAAGVYTPAGGAAQTVRVIARLPDALTGFGDTRIHTATAVFEVRAAEVAAPAEGDRLEAAGAAFVVQGQPMGDRDGLVWTLDVRPA